MCERTAGEGSERPSTDDRSCTQCGDSGRALRVALYSHDTMGIGHLRRNMLIAEALSRGGLRTTSLIIAGIREASMFRAPPQNDFLILPSVGKNENGSYTPRSLSVPLEQLVDVRSGVINAALEAYQPDVFIVDKVPRGVGCELDRTLKSLRQRGQTRCILGLRDVLDEPAIVRYEWEESSNENTIHDYFDAVWVYGDPKVYDTISENGFSSAVRDKTQYTGYLDPRVRVSSSSEEGSDQIGGLGLPPGRLVLCLVGGGQDGQKLLESFVDVNLPPETNAVVLLGPFVPRAVRQQLRKQAEGQQRLRVLDFISEPEELLCQAERVIAMGGYNTVCEVLAFEKPALIVPRVKPRREQLIRAERLQKLGLIDMLHPDDLSSRALEEWISSDLKPRPSTTETIDLMSRSRLPQMLADVLAGDSRPSGTTPTKQQGAQLVDH